MPEVVEAELLDPGLRHGQVPTPPNRAALPSPRREHQVGVDAAKAMSLSDRFQREARERQRAAVAVLGLFESDHLPGEVDVGPTQPKELASPRAGRDGQHDERIQVLIGARPTRREQGVSLVALADALATAELFLVLRARLGAERLRQLL